LEHASRGLSAIAELLV